MPALDARLNRLQAAHTLPVGISIDSTYAHSAWAAALGGVSLPLVSDFHPKGEIARSFGCYLEEAGITDRATVIIDASGVVRFAEAVGPGGSRDIDALVAKCEALDAEWTGDLPEIERVSGLPEGAKLYVRDNCMFSRWALYTRDNLHLGDMLPVVNVSRDEAAKAELQALGGKAQAPALRIGDQVMFESADIAKFLGDHCAPR